MVQQVFSQGRALWDPSPSLPFVECLVEFEVDGLLGANGQPGLISSWAPFRQLPVECTGLNVGILGTRTIKRTLRLCDR